MKSSLTDKLSSEKNSDVLSRAKRNKKFISKHNCTEALHYDSFADIHAQQWVFKDSIELLIN